MTSIGNSAFSYCSSLANVVLPESVTNIGRSAFAYCTALASINLPKRVTNLGDNAFEECTSLNSIVIPEGLTSIGAAIFYNCSSLNNIVIPEGLSNIGRSAFYDCTSLTSVTLPAGMATIDYFAFKGCSNLTSITIPDSMTSIGSDAFNGCTKLNEFHIQGINTWLNLSYNFEAENKHLYLNNEELTELIIPEGVTTIGDSTFYGCSSLTSIDIPESVTSIGTDAFKNCTNLRDFHIQTIMTWLDLSYNFEADNKHLYINNEEITEIIIPDEVTSIGDFAFSGCASLTKIIIPEGVTNIGNSSFCRCSRLESVLIPEGVTRIGDSAFSNCSSLANVVLPETIINIGENAFSTCSRLTSITIPGGVTNISDSAFSNCSRLTNVTIPESVTSIGNSAFSGCSKLTSIMIPQGVNNIGEDAFQLCSSLTSIIIPEGIASIGKHAFYKCTSLASITIPEGITNVGSGVIDGCRELHSFHIQSIKAWLDFSFNQPNNKSYSFDKHLYIDGTEVTDIVIPDGVTTIGNYAFFGCTGITSVVMSNIVTKIGHHAFMGCNNLESITLSDNVKTISYYTFYGCSCLANVKMPIEITWIREYAFTNCESLKNVVIPEGVTQIAEGAFSGCYLDNITIPRSVTFIADNAFSDNPQMTITGYNGSYAQEYAKSNGRTFIHIHELDKTEYKAPSCEEDGNIEYWTCSVCGKFFSDASGSDEILKDATVLSATSHNLSAIPPIDSTCSTKGHIEYWTCNKCGKLFADANADNEILQEDTLLPLKEHKWNEGIITKEATENENGEMLYICEDCGKEKTEDILSGKNTHIRAAYESLYRWLYDKGGTHYYYYYRTIDLSLENEEIVCKVKNVYDGFATYITFNINSAGVVQNQYVYSMEPDGKTPDYFVHAIIRVEHEKVMDPSYYYFEQLIQGARNNDSIEECQSLANESLQSALGTLQNNGIGNVKLEDFGFDIYNLVEEIHSWDQGVISVRPTCTENGEIKYTCSTCGTIKIGTIQALGHYWDKGEILKQVTCTEDGKKKYTCLTCGETRTETVTATGHQWNNDYTVDKVATCIETGIQSIHCAVCGEIQEGSETEIPKIEHVWGEDFIIDKEPTCTKVGIGSIHCTTCNEIRKESLKSVPALGHAWSEGAVTREATCLEEGEKTYTCARCGEIRRESIPTLGHDYVPVITSASPDEDGKIESTCTHCGDIESTEIIPKASDITLAAASYVYDGKVKKPAVTVTDSAGKAIDPTYYTVTYATGRSAIGQYAVTVAFNGNYTGTKGLTFKIIPQATKASLANTASGVQIKWTKVSGATGYVIYKSGKRYKTVTGTSYTDTAAKTNGTTYTYKVYAYKKVDGTNIYSKASTSVKYVFLTRPTVKSAKNTVSKKMTVTWNKNTKATGYQIKYVSGSTSKTVKVTSNKTVSKVIGILAKGKSYKVYVRSYKTVSGKTYYSAWSAAKSVKIIK